MKFNVLICDNMPYDTGTLRKYFSKKSASVSFCRPKFSEIEKALSAKSYDVLFLYTDRRTDMYCRFISRIKSTFPDIKIFTGNLSASLEAAGKLRSAGADMCIEVPVSLEKAAVIISVYMKYFNDSRVPLNIACFLSRCGFSAIPSGFRYLCCAVELCLREPESLESLYENVYRRVSSIFGVHYTLPERLIRNTASELVADGSLAALTGLNETKITNHDLIATLCDIYVSERYFLI